MESTSIKAEQYIMHLFLVLCTIGNDPSFLILTASTLLIIYFYFLQFLISIFYNFTLTISSRILLEPPPPPHKFLCPQGLGRTSVSPNKQRNSAIFNLLLCLVHIIFFYLLCVHC